MLSFDLFVYTGDGVNGPTVTIPCTITIEC